VTPEKAHTLGVRYEDVRVETYLGRFANRWIVYVQDSDRRRVLFEHASPFVTFIWKNELRKWEQRERTQSRTTR
jgi:hypothetical protein